MKQTKGMVLATTGALLIGLSTVSAFADDPTTDKRDGQTDTTVTFKEGNSLTLNHVPEQYKFESEVKDKTYKLFDGSLEDDPDTLLNNKIVVFNNKSTQKWKVTVDLTGGLTDTKNNAEITDPLLQITTGTENSSMVGSTAGTGTDNIVYQNTDTSLSGNTGTLRTLVKNVQISFKDDKGQIKEDSKLTGTVHYTLVTPVPSE